MIRIAEQTDVPAIVALINATTELRDYDDGPDYMNEELFSDMMQRPDDLFIVYEINHQIVGVLIAQFNRFSRIAYIHDVCVASDHRGQGIGSQLFDYVDHYFQDKHLREIWCLVDERNQRMLDIMHARGFSQGRKFYYMSKGE